MSGTILSTWEKLVNKAQSLFPHGAYILPKRKKSLTIADKGAKLDRYKRFVRKKELSKVNGECQVE